LGTRCRTCGTGTTPRSTEAGEALQTLHAPGQDAVGPQQPARRPRTRVRARPGCGSTARRGRRRGAPGCVARRRAGACRRRQPVSARPRTARGDTRARRDADDGADGGGRDDQSRAEAERRADQREPGEEDEREREHEHVIVTASNDTPAVATSRRRRRARAISSSCTRRWWHPGTVRWMREPFSRIDPEDDAVFYSLARKVVH